MSGQSDFQPQIRRVTQSEILFNFCSGCLQNIGQCPRQLSMQQDRKLPLKCCDKALKVPLTVNE
jgi:hypothetical protein